MNPVRSEDEQKSCVGQAFSLTLIGNTGFSGLLHNSGVHQLADGLYPRTYLLSPPIRQQALRPQREITPTTCVKTSTKADSTQPERQRTA